MIDKVIIVALLLLLSISSVESAFFPCPLKTNTGSRPGVLQHIPLAEKRAHQDSDTPSFLEDALSKQVPSVGYLKILRHSAILISAVALPIILRGSQCIAMDIPMSYHHLNIPNLIPDADPRYFLSGGLCAATSHGITTPIDVVKTRMQAEPEIFNEGLFSAAKSILKKDGTNALLGGLGPTVIGYGVEGAMKFGLYESLKPAFASLLALDSPQIPYLLASLVAGAVASLLLCPMERTRIRLVTDPTFASGTLTGTKRLVKEDGFLSLFSGMPVMLSKQVPYTFSKQVSFDMFAGLLYAAAANAQIATADVKFEVSLGAAFLASILSCLTSHPGDVLLTATYKTQANVGFREVVSNVYQKQGIGGFFTGLSARFLHVSTIVTSQLVLYDILKQLLGLPATGAQ